MYKTIIILIDAYVKIELTNDERSTIFCEPSNVMLVMTTGRDLSKLTCYDHTGPSIRFYPTETGGRQEYERGACRGVPFRIVGHSV